MSDLVTGIITAFDLIISLDPEVIAISLQTLKITLTAVLFSSLIAFPLGFFISFKEFSGKKVLISIIQTLYALPTVIVGLISFMLLSRTGPLGFLGWLFTPTGMVFGQVILVIPIMTGLTITALKNIDPALSDTIRTLGASQMQFFKSHLIEAKYAIMGAVIIGFSRAISEVGAAIMIGGNIKGHTRVLTTAISLQTSMGNFSLSFALGVILLLIALIVNISLGFLQQREA